MKLKTKIRRIASIVIVCLCLIGGGHIYGELKENDSQFAACSTSEFTPVQRPSYAEAAIRANQGLQTCFQSSFEEHWYTRFEPSFFQALVWPLGQAISGSLALTQIPNPPPGLENQIQTEFDVLDRYWNQNTDPPGYDSTVQNLYSDGVKYYDDNIWVGLDLVEQYRQGHDDWYLKRAEQVLELQEHGAKNTGHLSHPGGVTWTQKDGKDYRAAVSTAGAVELALQLYTLTHESRYLQFAQSMYAWVNDTLRAPDGLYFDGIRGDGTIETTKFSYNQGLMVGNSVLLYQVTGDHKYLQEAEKLAEQSLQFYGTKDALWLQPPVFNSIFFKNLLMLEAVNHNPQYRAALAIYADKIWDKVNPQYGTFFYKGSITTMLDQAAAVQIFSYLATPPASQ